MAKSAKKNQKLKQPQKMKVERFVLSKPYRAMAWELNLAYDEVKKEGHYSNSIKLFEQTLENFYNKYNRKPANKHHISMQLQMTEEQINELGLEDTVIMMGFVSNVTAIMNLMDVQVNCSFGTEATSLSLLEGMSLGKPAVVSNFGGNPGVITDGVNGFMTPTHSVKELADKIELLFTDEILYERISANCKKIYNTKFTAQVNTRAIEEIYKQVKK